VTLVVLGILAAVGYSGFAAVRGNSAGVATGPLLSVAQLEARRMISSGEFPVGVVDDLVSLSDTSLTFTGTAATEAGTVSVYRIDGESLVFAAPSGEDCLVLVDRLYGSSTWARVLEAASDCSAGDLVGTATGLVPGGSAASPQEVTGG
jgi:hypothetical protein